jgi:hypothetical protein
MSKYIQYAIIIILGAAVIYLIPKKQPEIDANITDFDSCEMAGGTLVDGEPVKCIAPDGREFEEEEHTEEEVVLETPKPDEVVTSPLTVKGKARGTWFFEANIPVTLKDENGKVLAQKGFMATEDWMTTDYVDFEGTLEFDPGDATSGILFVEKDNPSGLPEFDGSYAIRVRFK